MPRIPRPSVSRRFGASRRFAALLASGLLWGCTAPGRQERRLSAAPEGFAGAPLAPAPAPGDGESTAPAAPAGSGSTGNLEGNPSPQGNVAPTAPPAGGSPAGADPAAPPSPPTGPAAPPFARFEGRFILGADISSVPEAVDEGAVFIDTDGVQKSMLELLANHGFNFIRLRTFVDPLAPYGYGSGDRCPPKAQAYADRDHTAAFAREIQAAGFGLLLDFHYSDTWADPGKQVIPEAWRGAANIAELAEQVRAYTVDTLEALADAGVRPDLVQVGNEITPGMLMHVPTEQSDCYGNNSRENPGVNGSARDWDNLATLLRAGIDGVHQVDPSIRILLHIENTDSLPGVTSWVRNALSRGVAFEVLGLSAYTEFQGPASAWRGTLQSLAGSFPELSFAIAEYNPERRLLNDLLRELPDGRGLGTFFWEPTLSGSWGNALFDRQGNRFTARADDFAEYDRMRADYGL